MVEPALVVIEAEQKRAHPLASLFVAETADHAVGGAQAFDLEHGPLARGVGVVQLLGDHAVERHARAGEPAPGLLDVLAAGRQADTVGRAEAGVEGLQFTPAGR